MTTSASGQESTPTRRRIVGMVATDPNGAIGRDGKLPWHYPADLRFFREQTSRHACVMGRRTWESIGKPLRNRLNVVLTTRPAMTLQPSLIVVPDKASVLALREYLACDLYIVGGANVYREFSAEIDRWIVTRIPVVVEDADTFMPGDFLSGFTATETRSLDDDLQATIYDRSAG